MEDAMAVDEAFFREVEEKLGELSGEKPTVSAQEIVTALGLTDPEEVPKVEAALDELAAASVAVQVGTNAETGRMWRHTGMTPEEAQRALDAERETARREAEREDEQTELALARERAAEIEAERLEAEGDGEDDEPPARAVNRQRDDVRTQRVELPMTVAGTLSPEAVAEIVAAGIAAAKEGNVGFEFVVTP
jgi:hypothetical protein